MTNGIIHDAGEPEGLKQTCRKCGYVLADTEMLWWAEGPVAVIEGFPLRTIAGAVDGAVPCDRKIQ